MIEALLHRLRSARSAARSPIRARREYVFVLWDREREQRGRHVDGHRASSAAATRRTSTSTCVDEEKYSATLDRHFVHTRARDSLLVRRSDRDRRPRRASRTTGAGPSGSARSSPTCASCSSRCAAPTSATRCSPSCCRRSKPTARATCGRRSAAASPASPIARRTGSRRGNKEFIKGLFPSEVYATLLSRRGAARDRRGRRADARASRSCCAASASATRERVDPFDGGPHFTARDRRRQPGPSSRRERAVELDRGRDRAGAAACSRPASWPSRRTSWPSWAQRAPGAAVRI